MCRFQEQEKKIFDIIRAYSSQLRFRAGMEETALRANHPAFSNNQLLAAVVTIFPIVLADNIWSILSGLAGINLK